MAGHYYKDCSLPICSYGVICFRLRIRVHGPVHCVVRPEFLLVQRKDSLFFVEFVRGKYNPDDGDYVRKMLAGMTKAEQDLLRKAPPFGDLWQHLWAFSHMKNCMTNEFCQSRDKYARLLRPQGDAEPVMLVALRELEASKTWLDELEWGFPKGRRNMHENEAACALREFEEETGVSAGCLHLFQQSIDDAFVGGNNVRYAHKYYLARLLQYGQSGACEMPICSAQQAREVSSVRWMSLQEALPRMKGSRAKVLESAHRLVVQRIRGRWL